MPDPLLTFKDWRATRPLLLRLYQGAVPEHDLELQLHPFHLCAWFLLSGSVTVQHTASTLTAGKGEWMILPPLPRTHRFTAGSRIISLHFTIESPEHRPSFALSRFLTLPDASHPELQRIARQLMTASETMLHADTLSYIPGTPCDFPHYLTVQHHFLHWLSLLFPVLASAGAWQQRNSGDHRAAMQLKQQLDQLPYDRYPDLQQLADELNLSTRRMTDLYQQAYGMTPSRYADHRRANHARQLLLDPDHTISEVASELGFKHLSKFSNWFHRHEHCSPRQFRQRSSLPR
jgi:AraC-like DNA-binding protein